MTTNTDTLFMDIFVELFAIAKIYFQELFKNADPGTYTIKDIYAFIEKNIEATNQGKLTGVSSYFSDRYKKTLKNSPYYTKVDSFEKYTISYLCRVTGNIVSIEKENFKCNFDIVKVFEYLERFKKLSGAKDKLEFTKEVEAKEGQKATSFEVELSEKVIKSLISVKTEKKDIVNRYIENTVHLSLTDSTIYVTNCFVLKAKRVDVKNVLGETKDILIPFDVLKNIGAGNCNFTVTESEEMYKVVVKNTATDKVVSYSFKKIEKFLDYRSIFPKLYKEMNICLKDTKSFVDCIKTQQKVCKNFGLVYFMIQAIKGSKEIKVVTCNEAYNIDNDYKFSKFSFELKESSEFSGNYFYAFDKILKCLNDWNGNLYFDEIKLSFGMKAVDTCFCIGVLDIDKFFDKYSIVAIKPDKLTKIEIGTISEQNNDNVSEQKSKVLKPGEKETRLSAQSKKESSLNGKERDETRQTGKGKIQFLPGTNRNAYNVCENNECTFILKPKISAINYIRIGKELIKGDIIKVVGISGQKYFISFDGESVEASLLHSNINVMLKETEKVFDYLEKRGCTWEQPNSTKFYLIDKENEYLFENEFEAYLFLRDGSIQPKEIEPIVQYTDDMLELVSLDLSSMTYVVNGDIGTGKDITSIILYDKIGKIVAFFEDGEKRECLFDGESILQSVLKEVLYTNK